MLWLIELSWSPWKNIVYSPGLRMRCFVMICLRLLNTNCRNTWPLHWFFLISMRNKNYLWQHLIVTINKIYSAALQPLAFLRLALYDIFASVNISICFCELWSSHSTSRLLIRAAKEAKLVAMQIYLKYHCGSWRRSAGMTEQVFYQCVA